MGVKYVTDDHEPIIDKKTLGESLLYALVDKVKVNKDNIRIIWKDGTES